MKMHNKIGYLTVVIIACLLPMNIVADAFVGVSNNTTVASNNNIDGYDLNTSSVITSSEFRLFKKSLNSIEDLKCRNDLNATLWALHAREQWAVSMYDATVKSVYGVERGMLHHFGHYDECLNDPPQEEQYKQQRKSLTNIGRPVRAQYCLVDVIFNGLTVYNDDKRNKNPSNETIVKWGACIPASCNANDVAIHLETLLQHRVMVNENQCQLQTMHEQHITKSMFIYQMIIIIFLFMALMSTTYHFYLICMPDQDDELMKKDTLKYKILNTSLLSFSVIANTKNLFKASKDHLGLNPINGIKALAMLFILIGHVLLFVYGGPVHNPDFMGEQVKRVYFGFVTNSVLFVDAFLVLSGFLFCRILLHELERRRGKLNVLILYVGRYIRLTPAYLAVIGFYITWFPTIGDGPLWQQRIGREQKRCLESWWLNILYINNYIGTDNYCMFQSWYLSVDTQLFCLAPIAIYLLFKSRKHGLRLLIGLVVFTVTLPFIVTYVNKLDPTMMIYSDEVTDLASNSFYIGSYIKTHMRASAYVIGLLTGYLVHVMQEKCTKIPTIFVRLIWILSIAVGMLSMHGNNYFYTTPGYGNLEATFYAGFHKFGWNLSMAWLVLAVTTGHAVWLQRILSSRVFIPISRLTYCAYLSNGIVVLYHSSVIRTADYMSYVNAVNIIFGHVLDTFILAFIICLLFESPIHALERIILRSVGLPREHSNDSKTSEPKHNQSPTTSEEQLA